MSKVVKVFLIILALFFIALIVILIIAKISENGKILSPVKHKELFILENEVEYPAILKTEGNQIINSEGKAILFKGIMPADPARLHNLNKFNKGFFDQIKETGANIIRIPVHPENWVNDEDYLWRYLDLIVKWTGELNIYVIIDWHYIGNISTGEGQNMPDIEIPTKELTISFWEKVSKYFINAPHVLFEIYNEPADISETLWNENANKIAGIIRNIGAEQLIIIGGTQYGKNISWVEENPIKYKNIVYASHIYPAHKQNTWSYYFGNISKKYPVLITEWGFIDEDQDTDQLYLVGNADNYGKTFLKFLEERNIGWIACWYDNKWEPNIFKEDFKSLTKYGKYIKKKLKVKAND